MCTLREHADAHVDSAGAPLDALRQFDLPRDVALSELATGLAALPLPVSLREAAARSGAACATAWSAPRTAPPLNAIDCALGAVAQGRDALDRVVRSRAAVAVVRAARHERSDRRRRDRDRVRAGRARHGRRRRGRRGRRRCRRRDPGGRRAARCGWHGTHVRPLAHVPSGDSTCRRVGFRCPPPVVCQHRCARPRQRRGPSCRC